jgi:hypothetical protein
VTVEYRWADNQFDRLPELAGELVRRQVGVIAAIGPTTAFAAKAATTTIPIVFVVNDDPVRLGLVASLARPGGNLTGVNIFTAELVAKRLELLRDMVPGAARIAVLVSPTNAAIAETTVRDAEAAARALGLQIQVVNVSTIREIDAARCLLDRATPCTSFPVTCRFARVVARLRLEPLSARSHGTGPAPAPCNAPCAECSCCVVASIGKRIAAAVAQLCPERTQHKQHAVSSMQVADGRSGAHRAGRWGPKHGGI